jgi:hypothetical protein
MNRLRRATAILYKFFNLRQLVPTYTDLNELLSTLLPWLLIQIIEYMADAFELIWKDACSCNEG